MHPPTALLQTYVNNETEQQFAQNYSPWDSSQSSAGYDEIPGHPVACHDAKPHNPPVAVTALQQRIRRAEQVVTQHPFAAEILGFYVQVARLQQDLYSKLQRSAGEFPALLTSLPEFPGLFDNFRVFLSLVEQKAPAQFAQIAHHLGASRDSWPELLNHIWSMADGQPDAAEEFLAFAFLQPYAEFVRSRARLQLDGYTHALCPFCNRKPALGVLRPQGDGARRNLVCGFCLCEWEFRRIVCAGCGQEDQTKLPVYTAEQFPHIRVECCDVCHRYIKSIDLSKNGLADPLVDELASVPLDLWAQEHGYAKLHPNLLGM